MKKKIHFIKFIQIWGVIFILASGGGLIGIDIVASYRDFHIQADQIRLAYLERQNRIIRQEVMQVVEMIRYRKSQTENLTKEKIQSRTNEAFEIIAHIYQQHRNAERAEKIQQMALDALRSIRFENGTGYFFATRFDGVEMLFADRPQMEGRNLLGLQDTRGKYVIKDMIAIATRAGEGFYEYHWTKPGAEGQDFKKISFIKRFEPWDWFVGTGLYVDDIEQQVKADLLSEISRIRFGKEGYIFVNRLNGDALVSNGKLLSGTRKLWEVFNDNPEKMKEIFEKEHRAALKPNGDFVQYSFIKLSDPDVESRKTSFIYGLPDLQWLIGAGVYLDDVEEDIARIQNDLNSQIKAKILYSILAVIGVLALFYLCFIWLNRRLKDDLMLFASFFKRAAHSDREIDRESIKFIELDQMAEYANKMLADRSLATKALIESEARFKDLAEMLPESVFEADLAMNLKFVNQQAYALFGYSKKDFETGLNGYDMLVPEDRADAKRTAERRVRGEQFGASEYRGLRKDGTVFPLLLHTGPILENGKVTGIRGIMVDITERKKMEERLVESQKMESIGNLAAGIAHDFNNILFPIMGMSELLLEDLRKDSVEYENAMEILKAGKRGSDLVKQILAFSRQSEHKMLPVRPQKIFKEAIKLARSTIPSNIKINSHLQRDCGLVLADPTQLHQIAMNLITNAYHAVDQANGELNVTIVEKSLASDDLSDSPLSPGRYAVLSVSDNGCGIGPDVIDRIFEPYFTTKEKGKGTGLGLAMVYGIVKEYGGDVNVESRVGFGTTFSIYLPLIENDLEPAATESPEIEYTGTERILLVDDEEQVLMLEKQMLQRLGYRVIERTSSSDALKAFVANPSAFDLVVSDMTMPNMTGDQLARKLIAVRPDIPVIICTGFSERINKEKAAAIGVKGFLMKPIVKSELAKMVRDVLDGAEMNKRRT